VLWSGGRVSYQNALQPIHAPNLGRRLIAASLRNSISTLRNAIVVLRGIGDLPAAILMPFIPWPWKRGADTRPDPPIVAPFVLYSGVCTATLALWLGFSSRYAMPMAPSLAVLAGVAWERLEKTRYAVMRRITAIAAALLAT
jgi:hypothetical protein